MKSKHSTFKTLFDSINDLEVLEAGPEYKEKYLGLIDSARDEIFLHNYIFYLDEVGEEVLARLKKAVGRGVKVNMLLDAFGSAFDINEIEFYCTQAGINLSIFGRIFKTLPFQAGRRLHQKILCVDGTHFIIGGINIGNDFYGTEEQEAWLDYAVLGRGKVGLKIREWCKSVQERSKMPNIEFPKKDGDIMVRFMVNDWLRFHRDITKSFYGKMDKARGSVVIMNSYFFPRPKMLRMIENAL